jgi:three-Cys-motif partner protein
MSRRPPDKMVGPWAREKLDALRQYLTFYTRVLKNQGHWCKGTIFVDAFAGAGSAQLRPPDKRPEVGGFFWDDVEERDTGDAEYLKGSPRVALDIPDPFTSYLFIERDPERAGELERLKEEYGGSRHIEIRRGDANAELVALLGSSIDWRSHRAVVFLDPFGMHVPWSTIEALAKTRAIEVIINFPMGMAIQRRLPRSAEITPAGRKALDDFFGSPEWWEQAYEEVSGFFILMPEKRRNAAERLLKWYRERLKAAFGYVSPAQLICNTRGGHLYYLIWAGPHQKGLDGARHILGRRATLSKTA